MTENNKTAKAEVAGELRRLRETSGLAQRAVGRLLPSFGGDDVTGAAVGVWERGENMPTRKNLLALERLYDLEPGTLANRLGYDIDRPGVNERLALLEEQVSTLVTLVRDLTASRRRRS